MSEWGREGERERPDIKAPRTGLLVDLDHFFGGGLVVFREMHNDEPVIVIATFEQYGIRADLFGVLAVVGWAGWEERDGRQSERPGLDSESPGVRRRGTGGGALEKRRL
jgi:hypothetical protein